MHVVRSSTAVGHSWRFDSHSPRSGPTAGSVPKVTTPDPGQGRPVPDTDDLRLLAEIINNGSIGLPQAAWNARMSQAEAAARFVVMAERGMPLRLVAEGDRQLLWRIAQAGPATSGLQLPAATGPTPASPGQSASATDVQRAESPPPAEPPAIDQPPDQSAVRAQPPVQSPVRAPAPVQAQPVVEAQPVQQLPVPAAAFPPPPPLPPFSTAGPVVLPPASAVPPHEQAIAGAVPLGRPPFGTPPPGSDDAPAVTPEASTWGVPGSSAWARTEEPAMTQSYPPPGPDDDDAEDSPAGPAETGAPGEAVEAGETDQPVESDGAGGPVSPSPHTLSEPDSPAIQPEHGAPQPDSRQPEAPQLAQPRSPTHRVMVSGQPTQAVVGLFGEQLDVSLQQIIDPADQILTAVGYRLDPSERSLLVQTSVGNRGPIDYESLPDLYLFLQDGDGNILQKAAMAVGGYPAHRVGVPANSLVSGWTVFLVPAAGEVTEVRWSVRPDLANRTVVWGFGAA